MENVYVNKLLNEVPMSKHSLDICYDLAWKECINKKEYATALKVTEQYLKMRYNEPLKETQETITTKQSGKKHLVDIDI